MSSRSAQVDLEHRIESDTPRRHLVHEATVRGTDVDVCHQLKRSGCPQKPANHICRTWSAVQSLTPPDRMTTVESIQRGSRTCQMTRQVRCLDPHYHHPKRPRNRAPSRITVWTQEIKRLKVDNVRQAKTGRILCRPVRK